MRTAIGLLGTERCLDFLESGDWPITGSDLDVGLWLAGHQLPIVRAEQYALKYPVPQPLARSSLDRPAYPPAPARHGRAKLASSNAPAGTATGGAPLYSYPSNLDNSQHLA